MFFLFFIFILMPTLFYRIINIIYCVGEIMDVLEFDNVSMLYCKDGNKLLVLDDINFKIEEGELVAIVGPSGCGKTTILNLISKLIEPSEGDITINGNIGYMFQHDHLLNFRNVYHNILLGLEIKKSHKDQKLLSEVDRLIDKYGLKQFINSFPKELSGGMRQRVALIRTLAVNPNILLLDEPFAALDYQTKITVSNDIYRIIKEEKKTAILVTHDISEAISMADRIIVLSNRPASIKAIHKIELTCDGIKTPYEARKAKEFRNYYDLIWRELQNE